MTHDGAPAAVGHYQESPTPNLIVVESTLDRDTMLHELDQLAECCDSGTKVIVIGRVNDTFHTITSNLGCKVSASGYSCSIILISIDGKIIRLLRNAHLVELSNSQTR